MIKTKTKNWLQPSPELESSSRSNWDKICAKVDWVGLKSLCCVGIDTDACWPKKKKREIQMHPSYHKNEESIGWRIIYGMANRCVTLQLSMHLLASYSNIGTLPFKIQSRQPTCWNQSHFCFLPITRLEIGIRWFLLSVTRSIKNFTNLTGRPLNRNLTLNYYVRTNRNQIEDFTLTPVRSLVV